MPRRRRKLGRKMRHALRMLQRHPQGHEDVHPNTERALVNGKYVVRLWDKCGECGASRMVGYRLTAKGTAALKYLDILPGGRAGTGGT